MKRVPIRNEFLVKSSPALIYHFITSPDCLIRWFCDQCEIDENKYVFSWEGNDETAYLIDDVEDVRLRFKWEDSEHPNEYFEFRIGVAEITNETILEVVDFGTDNDVKELHQYWSTLIDKLKRAMGAG